MTPRDIVHVPAPGVPLVAEVMSIDGTPQVVITDAGYLVGRFPDLPAVAAAGIDLTSVTIKETR